MSVDQAYNYRKIDDKVSTAGVLSEEHLISLGPEGYEAVVNLLPMDSEYAVKGEGDIVQSQGLDYRYIPVDFAAPNEDNYREFTRALDELRGRKLMIHCAANYRVSAFYAMYAHQHLDWTSEQASEWISSIWDPKDHAPWAEFVSTVVT